MVPLFQYKFLNLFMKEWILNVDLKEDHKKNIRTMESAIRKHSNPSFSLKAESYKN